MDEFSLISQYFSSTQSSKHDEWAQIISPQIGDDCVLFNNLAISTDMLVAGQHFFPTVDAQTLGHKALAVNLSDLAAMGAQPLAFTLSLALPTADPQWLAHFRKGLLSLAKQTKCTLIGGDTTCGSLTISITIFGEVLEQQALYRKRAQNGDQIWVSGLLGDARLALGALKKEWVLSAQALQATRIALERPIPRIALGLALRGVAHAAIDLSDGLIGDLTHILQQSQKSAQIYLEQIPCSYYLRQQPQAIQRQCVLGGGDDYELCFTAPSCVHSAIQKISQQLNLPLTCIGQIQPQPIHYTAQPFIRIFDHKQELDSTQWHSFSHFAQ